MASKTSYAVEPSTEKFIGSVEVLKSCIELQLKKSRDYQNPNSSVVQADYYPRGIDTIMDIVHGKMLRVKSLTEASKGDVVAAEPYFESIKDSIMDAINYLSFAASWVDGTIPGQRTGYDIFNVRFK